MTKPKHSPLPWKKDNDWEIVDANGERLIVKPDEDEPGFNRLEDEAFALLACNSHYELVEALAAIVGFNFLDENEPQAAKHLQQIAKQALNRAKNAIERSQ
jgi:hypothetical protein